MNIILLSNTSTQNHNAINKIDKLITLIDDHHFLLDNKIYQFDYLIVDDLSLIDNLEILNLLVDDHKPVVNFFLQTSLEHVYYLNGLALEIALSHLFEGE